MAEAQIHSVSYPPFTTPISTHIISGIITLVVCVPVTIGGFLYFHPKKPLAIALMITSFLAVIAIVFKDCIIETYNNSYINGLLYETDRRLHFLESQEILPDPVDNSWFTSFTNWLFNRNGEVEAIPLQVQQRDSHDEQEGRESGNEDEQN